jgi:release factor glutamine methyltransferase
LLVELAVELAPRRVLDLGTGSGAIALAIADELPNCELIATDTSAAALEVARANADRLSLDGRVEFVEAMLPADAGEFDLIVANLPYVAESEWGGLAPEVTRWEPREALLAGPDGLDVLRAAIPAAAAVAPQLALEVGAGQAPAASEMLFDAGFTTVETRVDLAGIPRVVWGRR